METEKVRDERVEDKAEQGEYNEEGKGEVKKRGRPMNIERLGKERSASAGKIDEIMKRKRERTDEKGLRENEREIFKDSKKIARSPVKADGTNAKDDEIVNLIKAMRTEMREGIEEGKRRAEVQEKWLRAEIGELKEEVRKKADRMEKELEKMKMEMKVGIRTDAGDINKKVRRLLNEIGIEEGIGEINMVNKEKGVAMVKLENMETKKKVMKEKKKLVGRKERIEDDMTWSERNMQNKISRIGYEERKKGCKVWVKYGRIEINGKWWKWDERKGVLRDSNGRERNPVEQERLSGEEEDEGLVEVRMRMNEEIWSIVGIYVNNDMERKLECLDEWTEKEQEGKKILIGGDFNARIGREGGEEGHGAVERQSKDET
ncbi:hypothetical protein PV328_012205, partial [Microctonus aethiopoides]